MRYASGIVILTLYFLFAFPLIAQEEEEDLTIDAAQRLNQAYNGSEANAETFTPSLAVNGSVVVFSSAASNLVENDTNELPDIFVADIRDLPDVNIKRVNTNVFDDNGQQSFREADGISAEPAVSLVTPEGGYAVAFVSFASNLVTRNAFKPERIVDFPYGEFKNIFITFEEDKSQDAQSENHSQTHILSFPRDEQGLPLIHPLTGLPIAANGDSKSPAVAILPGKIREARVVFASDASNLVANDLNGVRDVFLAKLKEPKDESDAQDPNTAVSRQFFKSLSVQRLRDKLIWPPELQFLATAGTPFDHPKISGDGETIVFEMLVPGSGSQVMLFSMKSGKVLLVSRATAGALFGDGNSRVLGVSFSGNKVVYKTQATNILQDSTQGGPNVVVFDVEDLVNSRVNASYPNGTPGDGSSGSHVTGSISGNGRLVVFSDDSTNLVSDTDTNGLPDVFAKDLKTQQIWRVTGLKNEANDASRSPTISAEKFNSKDGFIAYASLADNLVSDDSNTFRDVFVNKVKVKPPPFNPKETKVETPPELEVVESAKPSKKSKVLITMQEFSEVSEETQAAQQHKNLLSAKQSTLWYRVRVRKKGTRKLNKVNRKLLTKKTQVTIKRLTQGTYNVRYRVLVKRGSKKTSRTTSRSSSSPTQSVSISSKTGF